MVSDNHDRVLVSQPAFSDVAMPGPVCKDARMTDASIACHGGSIQSRSKRRRRRRGRRDGQAGRTVGNVRTEKGRHRIWKGWESVAQDTLREIEVTVRRGVWGWQRATISAGKEGYRIAIFRREHTHL